MVQTPTQILVALASVLVITTVLATPVENGMRLIITDPEEEGHWVKAEHISTEADFHFMDITNNRLPTKRTIRNVTFPTTMKLQSKVTEALNLIQEERLSVFMNHFSSYVNRHFQTEFGKQSAQWLHNQVTESIASSNYQGNATVYYFEHHHEAQWVQPSVITRLDGTNPELSKEVVIIGAHLDSINTDEDNPSAPAPGANDNASGSAVLLEALRVLLELNFVPRRSIEFQWYAAEEDGLRGSLDIAETYYNASVNVAAMVNFDMASYSEGIQTIAIIQDEGFTHPGLNEYLKSIIEQYTDYGHSYMECGGACSDHVSFIEFGYPAASPVEPIINAVRHTEGDNMTIVNFKQLVQFTKLGVAYVIEMGESGAPAQHLCYVLPLTLIAQAILYFTQ